MEEVVSWLNVLNIYKENYFKLPENKQEEVKISIQAVFELLPDCDLGMIGTSDQVSWCSRGISYSSSQKMLTLYKRNGKLSRYKDGSGDVDPILFLLYNPGFIYTKETAQKLINPDTEIQTREVVNLSPTIGVSRTKSLRL